MRSRAVSLPWPRIFSSARSSGVTARCDGVVDLLAHERQRYVMVLPGHVVQVVHRVVHEVLAERAHGEQGAVAAPTRAVPLVAVDRGERPGDGVGGDRQFAGDDQRVLLAVALGDGGHVLVPVGELRIVLGEHQGEPLFEQPEHVTDVAAVLERRPDVGPRPLPYRRA